MGFIQKDGEASHPSARSDDVDKIGGGGHQEHVYAVIHQSNQAVQSSERNRGVDHADDGDQAGSQKKGELAFLQRVQNALAMTILLMAGRVDDLGCVFSEPLNLLVLFSQPDRFL